MALVRLLTRLINQELLLKEIKEQFPTKFQKLDLGGYEIDSKLFTTGSTAVGRIWKARLSSVVVATSHGVPTDTFAAGEIRIDFNPEMTVAEETTLDNLIVNHDETDTNPRQNAEEVDSVALADIERFKDAEGSWDAHTAAQQDQHMDNLERMVLRIWDKLDPGE